ncbi:putative membrane protein [Streptomyces glaucescens]|uniref:Putative membrane protein n=1 Tax=Streptomyces glaucescens TaxID=1907 RepID=A0A089XHV9_STRGA|nr:putative membrane protein [Streptomyces glaucescens]
MPFTSYALAFVPPSLYLENGSFGSTGCLNTLRPLVSPVGAVERNFSAWLSAGGGGPLIPASIAALFWLRLYSISSSVRR